MHNFVVSNFAMEGGNDNTMTKKEKVCVTGGTGFVASWLIKRLLEHGYSVNTTIRPGSKKDISFLTKLPHAHESLRLFEADLSNPDSFKPAIEGCTGVFHVAHPMEFNEEEESVTRKSVNATLGILQACVESGTVRRVVYTSSASTVMVDPSVDEFTQVDESRWTDVDRYKGMKLFAGAYFISKTVTEREAIEFAKRHRLDLVTVIPTWIHGPFVGPTVPGSVHSSLALIMGNENQIKYTNPTPLVHTDDVARAHIHLFEYPEANGRYICFAVEATVPQMYELVSSRYPEFHLKSPDSLRSTDQNFAKLSSKKLLETGFRYKYGLQEMFDDAIECCKQKGIL